MPIRRCGSCWREPGWRRKLAPRASSLRCMNAWRISQKARPREHRQVQASNLADFEENFAHGPLCETLKSFGQLIKRKDRIDKRARSRTGQQALDFLPGRAAFGVCKGADRHAAHLQPPKEHSGRIEIRDRT